MTFASLALAESIPEERLCADAPVRRSLFGAVIAFDSSSLALKFQYVFLLINMERSA
jgi:hypothetical protein